MSIDNENLSVEKLRARTWNWLPTFLAVAEQGSVARAAVELHLTAAAVSRTLRLLESEMGEELFNRVGRGLVLNTRGAVLRDLVRSATSSIDRGLSRTLLNPYSGRLRVSSLGVLTQYFVVPTLIEMKREYENLIPENLNIGTRDATTLLARGEIDVAFYYEDVSVDGIEVTRIGGSSMSVYCGKGHPLFKRRRLTVKQVLQHPFSVPQVGDTGVVQDGWPSDIVRKVGMRITTLQSNVEVCRSGVLLTVLPDVAAEALVKRKAIRRLSMFKLPSIDVFAAVSSSRVANGVEQELISRVTARI